MTEPDVVAELDRHLLHWHEPLLERARYEIVRLRASLECHDRLVIKAVVVATPAIRDDALEEAARACVGSGAIVAEARLCASAIRALKEPHDG